MGIIRNKPFDNPTAWRVEDIGGKTDITINLEPRHIMALDKALLNVQSCQLKDITRDDFLLTDIEGDICAWNHEVKHGRGLLILSGFPIHQYTPAEIERLWYGLGTHFGRAVSQSVMGDLVGHVVDIAGPDSRQRAYRNSRELKFHTDRCDIVGMFCMQKAWKGGQSSYASALAIHDEILRTHPEFLGPLWRGFHLHLFGEQPPGASPYSTVRSPVFSERGGVTTVILLRGYVDMAANEFDLPVSELEWEALDRFEEIANRSEYRLDFSLEPGEAILFDNCTILHKRSAFEDHADPERKRHLMRLWLMDHAGRPTDDAVHVHKGPGGIRPQEGRTPYYANRK